MAEDQVDAEFQALIDHYYQPLYRFGLSLTQAEAEASDLTQQTFYLWATKGRKQLREATKVKSWLFTALYREFLRGCRRKARFVSHDFLLETENVVASDSSWHATTPEAIRQVDAATVLAALQSVDDNYRAALTLFYLEEHSYQEIAEILSVPIGTVMSRLSRGKAQLRARLAATVSETTLRTSASRT